MRTMFIYGCLFTVSAWSMWQDVIGKQAYLKMTESGWVNTSWVFWGCLSLFWLAAAGVSCLLRLVKEEETRREKKKSDPRVVVNMPEGTTGFTVTETRKIYHDK